MKKKSATGYTLIELMVTMALASIVLMFGVPSFETVIKDNRLITVINELNTDITLARGEAVKRSETLRVCARSSSNIACDSSGSWTDGWLVFVDADADGDLDDDGDTNFCEDGDDTDCLLRVHAPLSNGLTLQNNTKSIAFNSRGYSNSYNSTFILCDDRGASYGRGRMLSSYGRLRPATAAEVSSKGCS